MENKESKENENINNEINEEKEENLDENIINSFNAEFSGIIGKDLFEEEKKDELKRKKSKTTVLDEHIINKIPKESKISEYIQMKEINDLENSLNISLLDENKKGENQYLEIRNFPKYDLSEYDKIKKKVGKNILAISSFLLEKKLKLILNEINLNKKIGPLLPLSYLIEDSYFFKPEFSKEMNLKYKRLKNYICNYRTIFGDGNCFYRGVMFRYIELLILNKKSDIIKLLILDINKCYENPESKLRLIFNKQQINSDLIIQIMILIFELVENNKIMEAHQVFYKAILCSKDFDFLLIFYFRYILYEYIKINENKLYMENFPVLIGNLLPSMYEKGGKFDFDSFYQNYLLQMFVVAEKIIIYLTPFVLGINLEIILFDDNEDDVIKHFNYVGKSELGITQSVFLINKKNHYEILFNFFDNNNYNLIYNYYRNDIKPKFIQEDAILSNVYARIKNHLNLLKKENQNEDDINSKTTVNNKNILKDNIQLSSNNNQNEPKTIINTDFNHKVINNNKIQENLDNLDTQKNKCIICLTEIYASNKIIRNICKACLFKQIFDQAKKYYKEYLQIMINKINQATQEEVNNLFLNKIKIIIFEQTFNIKEIEEEIEFNNSKISFIPELISGLKKSICLYCQNDMKNTQFKLPCGCNFCSLKHLEKFFKHLVGYKLKYNYKCICAYEYKPYQILELCDFLRMNKIYENTDKYINHLKIIFQNFCCKCGNIKNKIFPISVGESNQKFHNICEDCFKIINNNKSLNCKICNKIHTYS